MQTVYQPKTQICNLFWFVYISPPSIGSGNFIKSTLSIDKMTGIQALERIAPVLPLKPGKIERHEFEYRRHGTQTLIAAFDMARGKVLGAVKDHRKEEDFAVFVENLISSETPDTRWRIICDNLNTHRKIYQIL